MARWRKYRPAVSPTLTPRYRRQRRMMRISRSIFHEKPRALSSAAFNRPYVFLWTLYGEAGAGCERRTAQGTKTCPKWQVTLWPEKESVGLSSDCARSAELIVQLSPFLPPPLLDACVARLSRPLPRCCRPLDEYVYILEPRLCC